MVKILSRSGVSLASVYDVKGSIAGLDQLESREVTLVHEMGATIFSERFSTFIRAASSGAIAQSTGWNVVLSDLPAHPLRIFAITVFVSVTSRVDLASVSIRDPLNGRESPIWVWDDAVDGEVSVRFSDDGAAVATTVFLQPNPANVIVPQMMAGAGQPQNVRDLAFRGTSNGFGAGTVTVDALIHVGFSQVGGLSSRGLPIPSW